MPMAELFTHCPAVVYTRGDPYRTKNVLNAAMRIQYDQQGMISYTYIHGTTPVGEGPAPVSMNTEYLNSVGYHALYRQ